MLFLRGMLQLLYCSWILVVGLGVADGADFEGEGLLLRRDTGADGFLPVLFTVRGDGKQDGTRGGQLVPFDVVGGVGEGILGGGVQGRSGGDAVGMLVGTVPRALVVA